MKKTIIALVMGVGVMTVLQAEELLPKIAAKTVVEMKKDQKVDFQKIKIDDKTKYTIVFHGTLDGAECIEENPRMSLTLMPRAWVHDKVFDFLPKMRLEFFDTDGKSIGISNQISLPFRKHHKYSTTFYPLPNAASVALRVQAGGSTKSFKVDSMSFAETKDQGAININPVVNDSGLYDYSAWKAFSPGAGLIKTKNGKVGFNAAYGSFGAKFPLKANTVYVGHGFGPVVGYAVTLKLQMFDSKNKMIEDVKIYSKKGVEFTTPKNCVSGGIHIRSILLDEVRINEIPKGGLK